MRRIRNTNSWVHLYFESLPEVCRTKSFWNFYQESKMTTSSESFFSYLYNCFEDFLFYITKDVLLVFALTFITLMCWKKCWKQKPSGTQLKPTLKKKWDTSSTLKEESPEIIIVGAGVLGSAFAAVLARDGRRVTVIERSMSEPDTFAGEVLQPGGYKILKLLGLENSLEGCEASKLRGFQIHDLVNKEKNNLFFRLVENEDIEDGRSFRHGRFVMGLRKIAMAESNVKFIEGTVINLVEDDGCIIGVQYKGKKSEDVKELYAPLTVVADGLFSNIRKHLISQKPNVTSHVAGVTMKTPQELLLTKMNTIISDSSVFSIYTISSNESRVLINIAGEVPRNLKDYLMQIVYPIMPDHHKESFCEAVQNNNFKLLPANYLPAATLNKSGVLLLGDAYNIRHPLTGGGMSIILSDIAIWRNLLQNIPWLDNYEAILQAKKKFYWLRKMNCTFVMNISAELTHQMFSAKDSTTLLVRKAYFEYRNFGEKYSQKSAQMYGMP
ncbi:squalene monooxygenase-like isoform X2 [Protopterus annectens]|uniref:squalene monooxygenase-like isoform X2 n=1 Tax=Protopterus annectens TaxID=7888 RepID=UPI001CFA3F03|nr:squalene monooxygenase-like isoform X2 [Protopterus annectens]